MAIWNGQQNTGAVLKAAEQWKQNCLVDDGSRHSAEEIWTAAECDGREGSGAVPLVRKQAITK